MISNWQFLIIYNLTLIDAIKNYYWSRLLAKHHCKFSSGASSLGNRVKLTIESHVKLGRLAISAGNQTIGAYTYIRSGSELFGDCEIGRFCSIGSNVLIGLEKNKHPIDWLTTSLFTTDLERLYATDFPIKPTKIGNDCWIGRDAVIMSGVTVGDGAIIGARALVTSDVPPFTIYAGIPAKLIRYRFSEELIEKIIDSRWWNFSFEFLEKLKLDDPELCVEQIKNLDASAVATYRKIRITKKGVELWMQ